MVLMFVCLLYPYFKQKQNHSFIVFIDSLTIEGMVLVVMGLVTRLLNSGAFSALSYAASRKFLKYEKSYEIYKTERYENKGFNYCLYLGIYCILLSLILSFFA